MTCSSGSVQSVADKTVAARQQVEKLQNMLISQDAAHKERFYKLINENLQKANIRDARQVSYNSDLKTEYTSEFSLDKIAGVIVKALSAAAKATDPMIPNPATSPEALAAYGDLVNSIAEAAKSSSIAASNLAFSMTRLSPGMFSFLYATSVNIKDVDTFGSEAVCSTAIYYCFMQSIDDLKSEAEFNLTKMDAKTLISMKALQAALVDDLAAGKIDIATWMIKDQQYSAAVQAIQERLNARRFKLYNNNLENAEAGITDFAGEKGSCQVYAVAQSAINSLSRMGGEFKEAIDITQRRVQNNYY